MDEKHFSVEDLVLDPSFRSWVRGEDPSAGLFWEEWLLRHPDKGPSVDEARELVLSLEFRASDPSPAEMKEVRDKIKVRLDSGSGRKRPYLYWIAAASVFLFLVGAGFFYTISSSKLNISTTFSETRELILPDGSGVVLNANSRIRYAGRWKENEPREVWLEGEAFFEVLETPGRARPEFFVHLGELKVKVLGTAFNAYNRSGRTSVVLQEGSVELFSENKALVPDPIRLKPGEKIDLKGDSYELETVNPASYSAWKDRRLVFEDVPLEEIARLLEDNYGYKTEFIKKGLGEYRFTGSFPAGQIEVLLKALEEAFEIRVSQEGKMIIFQ